MFTYWLAAFVGWVHIPSVQVEDVRGFKGTGMDCSHLPISRGRQWGRQSLPSTHHTLESPTSPCSRLWELGVEERTSRW